MSASGRGIRNASSENPNAPFGGSDWPVSVVPDSLVRHGEDAEPGTGPRACEP